MNRAAWTNEAVERATPNRELVSKIQLPKHQILDGD
jgi:hypothetical protein